MIGVAMYHRTDLTERPELIRDLLAAATHAAGRSPLRFWHGQFATSDRFVKQQKITEERIEQLVTDVRGGVFRSVQFDELPRSQQEVSPGYTSLHIELRAAANPRVNAREHPAFPYSFYMLMPRDAASDAVQLETCISAFSDSVNDGYGFVHVAADSRDALMEVTMIPMFRWGQKLSPAESQREERLKRCQIERVRIGRVICGTYWGNLLSQEIVEQLGGTKKIQLGAPAAVIRERDDGAVYLQATADVPTLDDARYRDALGKLEAYLTPVSISSPVH